MSSPPEGRLDPAVLKAAGGVRAHYAAGRLAVVQPGADGRRAASELRLHAAATLRQWRWRAAQPYAPECLTLNLSNRCNLACRYCFSAHDGRNNSPVLRDPAILAAAAALVAGHCREKGLPFQLVVHGGGEPTLHWEEMEQAVAVTRAAAGAAGIGWRSYIATNGVMDEDRCRWLAANFTGIGLSCDGPPDVQDRQRAAAGGAPTSAAIERTARCLRELGCDFSIRATITPATVERQPAIVAWLHQTLGATRIRFEPVYRAGAAAIAAAADPAAESATDAAAVAESAPDAVELPNPPPWNRPNMRTDPSRLCDR